MSKFKDEGELWVKKAYGESESLAINRLELFSNLIEEMGISSLLDVGCGNGRFLQKLSGVRRRVGIDHSQQMLNLIPFNCDFEHRFVDIEADDARSTLGGLGKFDAVTLKGVVHYLESPFRALSNLQGNFDEESKLIISFRNRLFNLNPSSNYFNSDLTKSHLNMLREESEYWQNFAWEEIGSLNTQTLNFERCQTSSEFYGKSLCEGLTDPFWNPDKHLNWRQFTPMEAITLLSKLDFSSKSLIPIQNSHTPFVVQKFSISDATSFVIVASKKRNDL